MELYFKFWRKFDGEGWGGLYRKSAFAISNQIEKESWNEMRECNWTRAFFTFFFVDFSIVVLRILIHVSFRWKNHKYLHRIIMVKYNNPLRTSVNHFYLSFLSLFFTFWFDSWFFNMTINYIVTYPTPGVHSVQIESWSRLVHLGWFCWISWMDGLMILDLNHKTFNLLL